MITVFSIFVMVFATIASVHAYPEPANMRVPFKFYTREDWGAAPGNDTQPLNTPVSYVVIHHTYMPAACHTVDECSQSMHSMQKYHGVTLEWGDIGYNFCIGSEGGAYEGRGWKTKGIHAGRANGVSVGICLIGDWRTELPPPIQLETTKALIEYGVKNCFVKPDYKLVGHRQVMTTECPGGALYEHIKTWDHFSPTFVL
ncbi:unnamed protein product [Diatraea saccharalis]|uniref:Peptidoglycan-recognition protein n=1 Tax=Diatraea saccharalis TaxID=40085 RepID=A0A9N9R6Y9_9NEOP|nr:unnamed protein product [Diatraea saccharalis]